MKTNMLKKRNPGPLYGWPMGIWYSLFFIVPIAIIVCYSFMRRDIHGGVIHEFTLTAYKQMFSANYGKIFLRTIIVTAVTTFITILISLPCGYAMARSKHQTLLLILVVIPFFTNSLIRIFAWMNILGENGLLNGIYEALFNIGNFITGNSGEFTPAKFMNTTGAIILVSVYMYLPYAILPVFTAVDRFDFALLEAARDLGASKPASIVKILFPGIKSGIISALIFTFIPIFGNYTVPQLVGGKNYMLGNIIMDQTQKARNIPLVSAFSVVLTVVSMGAILLMILSEKKEAELNNSSNKDE
ncbi:MAG: ABC transporter permease [Treponema sp.]|nr:ABC transporter permease [Candidatus Treponema equifaecale]